VKASIFRLTMVTLGLLLVVPTLVHALPLPIPPTAPKHGAPELDPSALVSGLALLGASVMLVVDKYRRGDK